MTDHSFLASLGWQAFFYQQLSLEEWDLSVPARIFSQHKSLFELETESGGLLIPHVPSMPPLTVGDWVLLDKDHRFIRMLERKSCFSRKAAGTKLTEQMIAANVDTAFIACSLNDDFNLNRIERYLCLAYEADVEPVVVLTKSDLCDRVDQFRLQVLGLGDRLAVEAVNCLSTESVAALKPWCTSGKTLVMLGSSGSGKSTLINRLLGEEIQVTSRIREADCKGRHTTTRRSLFAMKEGALLLDTPGMRELQLADCDAGVSHAFADIALLAEDCRFSDCQHNAEPGCAVQEAVTTGVLDERRLKNWRKLLREQALNAASLAERREHDRQFVRSCRQVLRESYKYKRGES
ncbi:ribosome small subunit-dependent GTPase A [Teredinibacter haidensis]|uniref:ribosome small subunit-dependent GTPase A n=1 Tax=Teredinibacter haidensis TaxID=2731755 RepID=UPI000AE638A6|nr:ribosome small subunit-dependent GTPase A [Teredinibacter haidensis]